MRDFSREWQWGEDHKQVYAGQWVALEGNQLLAASPSRMELSAPLKVANAKDLLIHHMSSPDDLPYIGI